MLSLIIWWAGILLGALVLFRGFWGKTFAKHPLFYLYIASTLLSDTFLYVLYVMSSASYLKWHWAADFLDIVLAFGIILEILKHILSSHRAAARFAEIARRIACAMAICAVAVCVFLVFGPLQGRIANIEFERDLIAVQAVFLLAVLGVIFFHGIGIGKNLKGVILGYGLCVGASLVILSIRIYAGQAFDAAWTVLQPLSYVISLVIWLATLWTDHPNPVPWTGIRMVPHSESFVARTRLMMGAMRSYSAKAARA